MLFNSHVISCLPIETYLLTFTEREFQWTNPNISTNLSRSFANAIAVNCEKQNKQQKHLVLKVLVSLNLVKKLSKTQCGMSLSRELEQV